MTYDLQAVSDYLSIRDISAQYNRFADLSDGERYAALFTEDGEFTIVGGPTYRGRTEIAQAVMTPSVTVHITTDPFIEVDGDRATQRSRLISGVHAVDGQRNEITATGWYFDELQRTGEGWRFYRRRVELDLSLDEVYRKMHPQASDAP